MSRRLFGTDGIRGMANIYPMTGEVAMAVGRAVAHVLKRAEKKTRIVIGKDTRLSGYMLEQALASGVCSMGADVILIGPLPTPGVAFVTQSMRADAGVMISASHNRFDDNGIKIFSADGHKLADEMEHRIESLLFSQDLASHRPTAMDVGKAYRIDDVLGRYIVFLKNLFPKELDLVGLKIVLDCANGAAYKVAPLVFEELGAEVIRYGVQPNGLNINEKCGALHPEVLAKATLEAQAHLGIALDGDGDRCILVDEEGQILDGDVIMGLCAIQMSATQVLTKNTVVATPMSNVGLELTLQEHGISMLRAPVGDRYVVDAMRKNGFNLGGEQSGHIVFLDHSTTGDGIMAALKVLETIKRTEKPLSELRKAITLFPQVRKDIVVKQKVPLESFPQVAKVISEAQNTLQGKGRVFVRYSGTEPLARVMVEGENAVLIEELASTVATAIELALKTNEPITVKESV